MIDGVMGMTVVVYFLGITAAMAACLVWLCHNRLVEIEYKDYRDAWLKDGKPAGFGDSRREAVFNSPNTVLRWVLSQPEWIANSPNAKRLFGIMRCATVVEVISLLALVLLGIRAIG